MAASYNELFGLGTHSQDAQLKRWYKLQDNAASTTVVDSASGANNGTLTNAGNTSASSVSGPNSWLPSALAFDGTNDYVSIPSFTTTRARSILFFARHTGSSPGIVCGDMATSQSYIWLFPSNYFRFAYATGNMDVAGLTFSSWAHYCINCDVNANPALANAQIFQNGSAVNSLTAIASTGTTINAIGNGRSGGGFPFKGDIAGWCEFDRVLTNGEIGEARLGPEPLNTAAPSISGSTTVGSVLTCSTGTWNSQSNGTLTYTYQWTRDGVNIGGATSSTYTTVTGDIGAAIRCRVRASNDGGYDATQDTSSNTVTVSGGGPTFKPAWALGSNVVLAA